MFSKSGSSLIKTFLGIMINELTLKYPYVFKVCVHVGEGCLHERSTWSSWNKTLEPWARELWPCVLPPSLVLAACTSRFLLSGSYFIRLAFRASPTQRSWETWNHIFFALLLCGEFCQPLGPQLFILPLHDELVGQALSLEPVNILLPVAEGFYKCS